MNSADATCSEDLNPHLMRCKHSRGNSCPSVFFFNDGRGEITAAYLAWMIFIGKPFQFRFTQPYSYHPFNNCNRGGCRSVLTDHAFHIPCQFKVLWPR